MIRRDAKLIAAEAAEPGNERRVGASTSCQPAMFRRMGWAVISRCECGPRRGGSARLWCPGGFVEALGLASGARARVNRLPGWRLPTHPLVKVSFCALVRYGMPKPDLSTPCPRDRVLQGWISPAPSSRNGSPVVLVRRCALPTWPSSVSHALAFEPLLPGSSGQ
jgi:hypothetical protein